MAVETPTAPDPAGGSLDDRARRRLGLLGLPTLALALGVTVTSAYLPTVIESFTGSVLAIGVLIGAQGVGAVVIPLVVGPWSDRLDGPLGGRLPFLVAGLPLAAAGLALMAFVDSLATTGVAVALFFAGYFVAYEPYRALYPDLIPVAAAGRGQSSQAIWRGIGSGLALLGGGLLLAIGQAAPFLVAAAVMLGCGVLFVGLVVRTGVPPQPHSSRSVRCTVRDLRALLREPGPLRAFFAANALWELSLASLLTFVILWMTRGLGLSLSGSALVVGAVALLVLLGAGASGALADRLGRVRVTTVAVAATAVGLLAPVLSARLEVLAIGIPFVAIGYGVLLSLPYALLIPLMPEDRHGALSGFYSVSRGVGIVLGPLLAGAAISLLRDPFAATDGYAAMWAVCCLALLASLAPLRRLT